MQSTMTNNWPKNDMTAEEEKKEQKINLSDDNQEIRSR